MIESMEKYKRNMMKRFVPNITEEELGILDINQYPSLLKWLEFCRIMVSTNNYIFDSGTYR